MLSGCGESEMQQSAQKPINIEAANSIESHSMAYIAYNCTPKYTKEADVKSMEVYSGLPSGAQPADKYFLINDPEDSRYGNFAVRTSYLASLYHWHLAHLYSYVYDIYPVEMKKVREDYNRYKLIADKSAREICALAKKSLSGNPLKASEEAKVQAIYDQLEANWVNFISWKESAIKLMTLISQDIEDSIIEMSTPKCDEYPTADGKYVVVKCTIPPG
jgi:hypothetical protein